MPNWVTNEITTSPSVIDAMLNNDAKIDFEEMMPSPCPHGKDWYGINGDAETAAELVCNTPLSDHDLLRRLEMANRAQVDVKKMTDESFEQFIGMVRNFRACGYLHDMDFNRKAWGTKWNACEQSYDIDSGKARFDTAWSHPEPVMIALSKRFPEEEIHVRYADEDMGRNCGEYTMKNGEYLKSDFAPSYRDQTEEVKEKWRRFACDVRGRDYDEYYGEEADE